MKGEIDMKGRKTIAVLAALLLTGLTACGSAAQTETKGTQSVTAGQKETEKSTSPAGQETARESEAVPEASSVFAPALASKVSCSFV